MNARALPMERPDRLDFGFHMNVTDELITDHMNNTWNNNEVMGDRLARMERAFSLE
jgi:hypothetical protein